MQVRLEAAARGRPAPTILCFPTLDANLTFNDAERDLGQFMTLGNGCWTLDLATV